MINFKCDYARGAHPEILKALTDTNINYYDGYGVDPFTASAKDKIRKAIGCPDANIHFLVGGTQTNSTVISTMLNLYEGVVAATTGHINVHEAGAVEYTGHKVLTLPSHQGKIDSTELSDYLAGFFADGNQEHSVYPGMVYISHPTEHGTLYSAKELKDIHEICMKYNILLFIDGARLGYGLMSDETDVTIEYLAHNCDAFYIGGTKVGALFGEAVVFPRGNEPKHFYTMTKQHGAMLAKGWLTGLQFDVLFTDDLYFKIARNAIETANAVKELIVKYNLKIMQLSPTNQQFVIVDNKLLAELNKEVATDFWENADSEHTVIRFATSWYTTMDDVKKLDEILGRLVK